MAKAADCKSAIAGSTPADASCGFYRAKSGFPDLAFFMPGVGSGWGKDASCVSPVAAIEGEINDCEETVFGLLCQLPGMLSFDCEGAVANCLF